MVGYELLVTSWEHEAEKKEPYTEPSPHFHFLPFLTALFLSTLLLFQTCFLGEKLSPVQTRSKLHFLW